MNYLLFTCSDGVPTPEKTAAMHSQIPAWLEEMRGRGVQRFGHPLQPAPTAASVRVRDGETLISDGPFAESKEFVAGFDLIECADLDEAIEVAAKHPVAHFHRIEVRPLAEQPTSSGGLEELEPPAPGRQRYLLLVCVNGIPESDEAEAIPYRVPSPVVRLNRAVAVAMAGDLDAGLAQVDALDREGDLSDYHLLEATRADPYRRRGDRVQAAAAYRRALEGARSEPESRFVASPAAGRGGRGGAS